MVCDWKLGPWISLACIRSGDGDATPRAGAQVAVPAPDRAGAEGAEGGDLAEGAMSAASV
eukprot:6643059-Pyramimonas_sp.AAC.1